jgi:protein TonB
MQALTTSLLIALLSLPGAAAFGQATPASSSATKTPAQQADMAHRLQELRQQVQDIGRSQRTLIVSSGYTGEFKPYVDSCQDKIIALGSRKYREVGATSEGELTAFIHIFRDGNVQSVKIYKSSGHPELDALLAKTVIEAAPFYAFPEALARDYDRVALTLRFRFRK